jgi:hypothetical protein
VVDDEEVGRALAQQRWVHVDGDDADHGAIYRDAEGDIPLSRRPREFLEFTEDGSVRRSATGPDDRAHEVDRPTWRVKDGNVVFAFGASAAKRATEYRVIEHTRDQLVVHRQ